MRVISYTSMTWSRSPEFVVSQSVALYSLNSSKYLIKDNIYMHSCKLHKPFTLFHSKGSWLAFKHFLKYKDTIKSKFSWLTRLVVITESAFTNFGVYLHQTHKSEQMPKFDLRKYLSLARHSRAEGMDTFCVVFQRCELMA